MERKTTRALLVEDNPADAFLVQEHLSQTGDAFDVQSADHLSAAFDSVSRVPPDVVLLDLNLPDSRGTETIRKMIQKVPNIPVLVLTGQDDEAMAVHAVQEGAQDYLLKNHLDSGHLTRAIKYAIERQSLLSALHQSREQQLHLKDQLLSHVSHELRSPLTCIHQFVTILLDGLSGPLSDEQRDCLETVLKSANQLRSMIDDLLETATIEAGKLRLEFKCVLLEDLIRQATEMTQATAAAKGVVLNPDLGAQSPFVYGDPHRILQILLNLIENAIKFTPSGGFVTVEAGTSQREPGFVVVTVRDTGCGISEEAKSLVFERLYQEDHGGRGARKGLGLGLSICRDLASAQGGRIWVESEPGQGSAFSFTLPVFSLSKLLFPIVVENGAVADALCLITIKLAPIPVTSAIEAWGKTRRKFLDLLQRCILPDKDVLLPPMGHIEMGEMFFIVAGTDANGAEVMVKRIREQVGRCGEITTNSVVNISSRILALPAESRREHLAFQVEAITALVTQTVAGTIEKGE